MASKKFSEVSEQAKKAIVDAGGSIDEAGNVQFPEGTETNSYTYQGWKPGTVNEWKLPTGVTLEWDSDARSGRKLQRARK